MVKMISISFDRIGTVAVRQGFSLRLTLFIVFVSLFPEIRTQTCKAEIFKYFFFTLHCHFKSPFYKIYIVTILAFKKNSLFLKRFVEINLNRVVINYGVYIIFFPWIALPGNPILSIIDAKNEGDTVTLTCTSYGGNPLPTVRWYKNTQLVDPGSSPNGNGDGVFTVGSTTATYNNYTFQVSRSDNAVSYICKVNSSLLTSELTRSLRIEVYGK